MHKLHYSYDSKTVSIFIETNLLSNLQDCYKTDNEGFIIADEKVPRSAIDKIKSQYNIKHSIRIPSGDGSKSLSHYEAIIDVMVEKELTKATTIFALGGGMIIDLAGFIASTYYRGLELVNIPTTLLAMADASIGGKNALNFQPYKNIIGTFYHPKAILIDPSLLETLSMRQRNNGFAEIIKVALIKDAQFFNALVQNTLALEEILYKAIKLKTTIIESDPYDHSDRHLLNYGHTIAHAIESHYGTTYLHGEAVAFGIKKMSKGLGFEKDLLSLLDHYQLNFEIPYKKEALFKHILHDKKRRKDTLKIAFVESPGKAYIKRINVHDFIPYLD